MKPNTPMKPGEIREVTGRENQFNLVIMILRNELVRRSEDVRARLAATPNGWRNLKLLQWCVDFVQDSISKTLPEKTLRRYTQYAAHGHLTIDMPTAIESPQYHVIEKKDLNELVIWAAYGKCSTCFLEGKEIKKCPLRKVLIEIAPPDELTDHNRVMGCEYIKHGQLVTEGVSESES